jgi:phosphate:Na+ symporter
MLNLLNLLAAIALLVWGTPALAIACAAREAMHQADVVEGMLRGIMPVIRDNNAALSQQLR